MPIIVSATRTSYPPAPPGTHAAVCVDVVDMGILKVTFGGKEKAQHKIRIVWQIDELRDDGNPHNVSKRYTLSLHEKATLRKDLESWRGRSFNDAELSGFDLEDLLSAPALLNVVHATKDGQTYANVTSIMKLPKMMEAPRPTNYTRVCDRETTNGAVLPEEGYAPIIDDSDVPF